MLDDSPPFYNGIKSRAFAISPPLVEDEQLFQSIVLAVAGHRKHLLVRTAEENVHSVLKLTVNIVHALFALSAVKLRFRPGDKPTPEEFLRLIFLRPASGQQSRPSSRKTHQGKPHNGLPFHRSSSYLSDNLSGSGDLSDVPFSLPFNRRQYTYTAPLDVPVHDGDDLRRGNESKLRDQVQAGANATQSLAGPSNLASQEPAQQPSKTLPHVLAISGMENTTVSVQRTLWKLLTDNEFDFHVRSTGAPEPWKLPDNFLVICVCPLGDTRERPPLHRSLLDRFALSINVFWQDENTDNRLSFASAKEAEVLELPPALSLSDISRVRDLVENCTHMDNRVDLYVSDLITATRHHPHLDGSQLTARAHADCLHILRTWRVLFGEDSPGYNLSDDEDFASDASRFHFDVTCEDARVVFPKVVTHRLRVLDGPKDEVLASVLFPAVESISLTPEWALGRRTVREVLKEIMDSV